MRRRGDWLSASSEALVGEGDPQRLASLVFFLTIDVDPEALETDGRILIAQGFVAEAAIPVGFSQTTRSNGLTRSFTLRYG
jgi:hypothetical protein